MGRLVLKAKARSSFNTKKAKRLRTDGFIPGVVYGQNIDTQAIAVDQVETVRFLKKAGRNAVFHIDLEGKKILSIIKNVQYDGLKKEYLNFDFQAISLNETLRASIPIVIKGQESLSSTGAIINNQTTEVEVECLPDEMDNQIEVDVSGLNIGDTVHIGDLTLPSSYKLVSSPEEIVLSITAPQSSEDEESDDAETADEDEI